MHPLEPIASDHDPIVYGSVLVSRAAGAIRISSQRGPGEPGPFRSEPLNALFRRIGADETAERDTYVVDPTRRQALREALGRLAAGRFVAAEVGAIIAYLDGAEPPDSLARLGPFMRDFATDLIAALTTGTLPWCRPWTSAVPHQNALTRRRYSGLNVMVLNWWATRHGLRSPLWCTARQVERRRGHLRADALPAEVTCARPIAWALDPWSSPEAPIMRPTRFAPRTFEVYNLVQIEGIATPVAPRPELPPDARAEATAAAYLHHGGPGFALHPDRAFYDRHEDRVYLPERRQFDWAADYYGVLFHELVHSTGHPARLARKTLHQAARFGEPSYAEEELVAEIGAAWMLAELGLGSDSRAQSLAYCQGWATRARADFPMLQSAIGQAQRAVASILGSCAPLAASRSQ